MHGFVTHLEPRESQLIPREIAVALKVHWLQVRQGNQVFEF